MMATGLLRGDAFVVDATKTVYPGLTDNISTSGWWVDAHQRKRVSCILADT